jgi:16S rRNA G966 N2-methylase RsmD
MKKTHINADMSHQNGLAYKFGEFFNSLKENGILSTGKKISQRINYKMKGLDFSTQNIYDLTRTGDYKEHGTALVSSSKDFLTKVIDDLELAIGGNLKRNLFVDYGSGKGSAIIHARSIGFKESVGIEFAKELHEIAEENIKKLNLKNVKSLYQDATLYKPSIDVSVIYFFNPFDGVVMERVIQNLLSVKDEFMGEVYIIYGNASCDVMDKYLTLVKKIRYPSGSTADFYKL